MAGLSTECPFDSCLCHQSEHLRHAPVLRKDVPCACPRSGSAVVGRLAHDPAEKREGVAPSDFLDVPVGVAPLDQTPDDVLAIRG